MLCQRATRRAVLSAAVGVLLAGCTARTRQPETPPAATAPTPTIVSDTEYVLPLVTNPPEAVLAAQPSDSTYSVYQGIVCGVVPRPEYGYTVRYPKIWEAREYGPTTWLVDLGNDGLIRETVGADPAPADGPRAPAVIGVVTVMDADDLTPDSLSQRLAEGWRSRGLAGLHLSPVAGAVLGGQPGEQWQLSYTATDGTPMAGYTSAALIAGRLFRVEIAMPADRYARRERASAIVADQLIIAGAAARS